MNFMLATITTLCIFTLALVILMIYNKNATITLRASQFTHTPYGNTFIISASIIWASMVSVFGSTLQNQWFGKDKIGGETLAFLIPVLVTVILSVLHYIQSQHKENKNQARPCFDAVAQNSEQTINTLGIVYECAQNILQIKQAEERSFGSALGQLSLNETIEHNLDSAFNSAICSILTVTRDFIEGTEQVHIKANVFNLIQATSIKRDSTTREKQIFSIASVEQSPFFLYSSTVDVRLEHCQFVLACDKALSCEIKPKNNKPSKSDEDTNPAICMPFTLNSQHIIQHHPNLFGAPEALLTGRGVYISNVSKRMNSFLRELKRSPKYKPHITEYYEQSIRKYYEDDCDRPKSILSIPIGDVNITNLHDLTTESVPPRCVLNIYVNIENFLSNDLKSETYHALLRPLCHYLSLLISIRFLYSAMISDYNKKQSCSQTKMMEAANG
ncbi:hypothetical protein ACTG2F_02185 [Aeromonas sp. 31P]